MVPPHHGDVTARAPLAEGRVQRRHRRARRHPAACRRRNLALLHERGSARRSRRVPREAQARLREVSASTVSEAAAVPSGVKLWLLGARPRTLGVGITPVIVGTSAAEHATVLRTIGCFLVALGLQVGVNYANDYSD